MSKELINGNEFGLKEILPRIEVSGYRTVCISSNIRTKGSIDWNELELTEGVGFEGSLVLGRVETLGARVEMEYLYENEIFDVPLLPNDIIVGVLANRHSGTSEYGEVPSDGMTIRSGEKIDLIAAGGILGRCLGVPKTLGERATAVEVIGLLADTEGKQIDILDLYPAWETTMAISAPIILSLGTAAEIGKTTTATRIIEGLKSQGLQVAASKVAGTGRKRDIASLQRAGATIAYDFPDIGLPTTYTSASRYIPAIYTLLNKINLEGKPDVVVAECGGDIIEANIPTLLHDENIMKNVVAIIHGSSDILSIIGSLSLYEQWNILQSFPIYLTQPIRRNYFASRMRLREQNIGLPVFDPMNDAENSEIVAQLMRLVG